MGRGLRLPFDTYTGLEILDGLEVLGHEKYEELLRKVGVLNERFVDVRRGRHPASERPGVSTCPR